MCYRMYKININGKTKTTEIELEALAEFESGIEDGARITYIENNGNDRTLVATSEIIVGEIIYTSEKVWVYYCACECENNVDFEGDKHKCKKAEQCNYKKEGRFTYVKGPFIVIKYEEDERLIKCHHYLNNKELVIHRSEVYFSYKEAFNAAL
jgi:hypothetical protein